MKDDVRIGGRRAAHNDGGQKRIGKRKQQIGRSEGRRGKGWFRRHGGDSFR